MTFVPLCIQACKGVYSGWKKLCFTISDRDYGGPLMGISDMYA
jgi:hypothetical protein